MLYLCSLFEFINVVFRFYTFCQGENILQIVHNQCQNNKKPPPPSIPQGKKTSKGKQLPVLCLRDTNLKTVKCCCFGADNLIYVLSDHMTMCSIRSRGPGGRERSIGRFTIRTQMAPPTPVVPRTTQWCCLVFATSAINCLAD